MALTGTLKTVSSMMPKFIIAIMHSKHGACLLQWTTENMLEGAKQLLNQLEKRDFTGSTTRLAAVDSKSGQED